MNQDIDLNGHNEVFLQMVLQKSSFKTNEHGDFIFDVEASNENLDLEGQRILQQALLNSKDYFLSNGVVSKDHLHQKAGNGGVRFDEEFVIGEPVDVYADGASTRVKGKLYASNPHAQKFIQMLKDGSTRVKASVGGLVPKVVNRIDETGRKVGEVASVLWNDLALTIAPVNPTVGAAVLAKSLSSVDFVKALSAGYGTDSSQFTGGRALQKEDVEIRKEKKKHAKENGEVAVEGLIEAMTDGDVGEVEEAEEFLGGFGMAKAVAREVVAGIVENTADIREALPVKKIKRWDLVIERMQKAFGKKHCGDGGKERGAAKEEDDDEVEDDEVDGEEDDIEDATPVIKSMAEKIGELAESVDTIAKSQAAFAERTAQGMEMQKSMGEGLLAIMERVNEIASTPNPRRSAVTALEAAMAKGGPGRTGGLCHKQFTPTMKEACVEVLRKAVRDGELNIFECSKIESQINKSLTNPGFQLDEKYIQFLKNKLAA